MKKKTSFGTEIINTDIINGEDPSITRFPSPILHEKLQSLTDEEKIASITRDFAHIMETLGLDLSNNSLSKTPERVAKMFVKEIFSGMNPKNFPEISFFEDEFHHEHRANLVFVKVGFTSFCEHHFVPMTGIAYVAYLPTNKLIGLSKIPRLVRYFGKRPQLQERLTAQIADSLSILLGTDNVAVSITAQHHCVIARGIEDESGHTTTNVLRGDFNTKETIRNEFFEAINR
jgi:GTP cyclohydrolase IA